MRPRSGTKNSRIAATTLHGPHVEINLDNVACNLRRILGRLPPGTEAIAVVKDCAYGCGAVAVARILQREGVRFIAVARSAEARDLRAAGIRTAILVLGTATPADLRWGSRNAVDFALNDLPTLERWARAGIPVRFHCKLDTGMGRLGLLPSEVPAFIARLSDAGPRMRCVGLFTHFACADKPGSRTVARQLAVFSRARTRLHAAGISPEYVHCANTAAALRFGTGGVPLVRIGIGLYGCNPDPSQDFDAGIKPVLSLKSRVVRIKTVPAGTGISYGFRYRTRRRTRIATVALGYGQGLPRSSDPGEILIRGRRYPIAGTITMDYLMVDVGPHSKVAVGDEAVAIGSQGRETITVDEAALAARTIGYEVLCGIPPTIDRLYIYGGRPFQHRTAILY